MDLEKSGNQNDIEGNAAVFANLPSLTGTNWGQQKVSKGWLIWTTDNNGVITALTFIPE
jgi:hypothetical protein